MSTRRKSLIFALGAIIILGIGIPLSILYYFTTPSGAAFALKHAQKILRNQFQTELTFSQSSIRPLHSLSFEDLKLVQKLENQETEIRIQKLDLHYSFSIASRSLTIEKAEISQPQISIQTSSDFQSTNPTPLSPPPSDPQSSLLSFFASGVKIWMKDFQMQGLRLHLKTPSLSWKSDFPQSQFKLSFQSLTNRLVASTDVQLGNSTSMALSAVGPDKELRLQGAPQGSLSGKASLQYLSSLWEYQIEPSTLGMGVRDLSLFSREKNETNELKLPSAHLDTQFQVHAKSADLFRNSRNLTIEKLFQEFKLKGTLSLSEFILKQRKETFRLGAQTATLTSDLGPNQLQMDLDFPQIELARSRQSLRKRWHVGLQSGISLNRSAPLEVESTLKIQDQKALHLKAQMKTISAEKLEMNAQVEAVLGTYLEGWLTAKELRDWGQWLVQSELNLNLNLPKSGIGRLMEEGGIQFNGNATLRQTSPTLLPHSFLSGLNTQVDFLLQDTHFSLRNLRASLNQSSIEMAAEANGDPRKKNFQTEGTLRIHFGNIDFGKYAPAEAGQSLNGSIHVPWSLSIYQGRDISINGTLNLANINWSKASTKKSPFALQASGISGKVSFSEQLQWKNHRLSYTHLIHQNPFERVDFERLQPMITDSDQVKVKEFTFEGKNIGPFQGYFSIRQNLIFAHQFDLKLGSGRTYGEIYLDTHSKNLQFGMLSRLSQIRLSEILPKRYLVQSAAIDEQMSGRSGLVVNLNTGNVDGRIDFTELGRHQLATLINTVDPTYENEKMNQARFALSIASPSWIQMSFQKGYMDLGFRIGGSVGQDFYLRGIPITAWISEASANIVKLTQEGSLP